MRRMRGCVPQQLAELQVPVAQHVLERGRVKLEVGALIAEVPYRFLSQVEKETASLPEGLLLTARGHAGTRS